jgi:hypothetical protein
VIPFKTYKVELEITAKHYFSKQIVLEISPTNEVDKNIKNIGDIIIVKEIVKYIV